MTNPSHAREEIDGDDEECGIGFSSREEFVLAARSFVGQPSSKQDDVGKHQYTQGWRWDNGVHPPFTQHLTRTGVLVNGNSEILKSDQQSEDLELLDSMSMSNETDSITTEDQRLTVQEILDVTQTIVFSSTWKVPVLYIEASRSDGSALSAMEIISSNTFLIKTGQDSLLTTTANATFPTFSIGENPANGHSCVFLHPCRTAISITNLLKQNHQRGPIDYLEAFIMLCSTVVEMRLQ